MKNLAGLSQFGASSSHHASTSTTQRLSSMIGFIRSFHKVLRTHLNFWLVGDAMTAWQSMGKPCR